MPRWVKVSGIIVAVLVLLLIVVLLISGGGHGPRRHVSGGSLRHALLSGVTADHARSQAHHRRP
jgi:preprotein translocase subunit SecG